MFKGIKDGEIFRLTLGKRVIHDYRVLRESTGESDSMIRWTQNKWSIPPMVLLPEKGRDYLVEAFRDSMYAMYPEMELVTQDATDADGTVLPMISKALHCEPSANDQEECAYAEEKERFMYARVRVIKAGPERPYPNHLGISK
ncbi:hypothetical protein EXS71_00600 [Candidatus Uhrbacteria bacterium]|nr:hypothetical protein [Candidatus Uhrbacteria bacterium]